MHILSKDIKFPSVTEALSDGLLAIGGDLSIDRLLLAYHSGIFPWYSPGDPIIWYSPDPRMVLFPKELKISKSMRQVLRKAPFDITFNTNFEKVIQNCASITRSGQNGSWITTEMQQAYLKLHQLGYAISAEVWIDQDLVGGLYGIWLEDQKIFCGESMFTKVSNASKFAFIKLVEYLNTKQVRLIDCQVYTDHLASLGAKEISRDDFMKFLDH